MCSFRDNDSTLLVPWTETDAIICSLIVAATQARLQVTLAGGDQARICEHREKPVVLYLTCPSSSSEGPGHWAPGGSKWCLCQEYSTRILLRTCGRNFTQCISTGLHKRRLEPFTLHRGSSYIAWKACQAKRQRRPKGRRELHSAILLPVEKQFLGIKSYLARKMLQVSLRKRPSHNRGPTAMLCSQTLRRLLGINRWISHAKARPGAVRKLGLGPNLSGPTLSAQRSLFWISAVFEGSGPAGQRKGHKDYWKCCMFSIISNPPCCQSFFVLVCQDVLLKLQVGTDDTRRLGLFNCSNESLEDILLVPLGVCEASG